MTDAIVNALKVVEIGIILNQFNGTFASCE